MNIDFPGFKYIDKTTQPTVFVTLVHREGHSIAPLLTHSLSGAFDCQKENVSWLSFSSKIMPSLKCCCLVGRSNRSFG